MQLASLVAVDDCTMPDGTRGTEEAALLHPAASPDSQARGALRCTRAVVRLFADDVIAMRGSGRPHLGLLRGCKRWGASLPARARLTRRGLAQTAEASRSYVCQRAWGMSIQRCDGRHGASRDVPSRPDRLSLRVDRLLAVIVQRATPPGALDPSLRGGPRADCHRKTNPAPRCNDCSQTGVFAGRH
ncbi:hypothetical protein PSPO01_02690 [Paraphaeosphaeria sporulosa]